MFTKKVYDTWNPQGIDVNGIHCLRTENELVPRAGDFQALKDVVVGLFLGQGSGLAAQHDALAQLPEFGKF